MNLVEQLLKADVKKAEELETKVIKSKKLGKLLGLDEAVEMKISEINPRKFNELCAKPYDKSGNLDTGKMFDTKALICVEGIIEPSMKDKKLQEHFGCSTPKDLVVKLFGNEITNIHLEIDQLCSGSEEEREELEKKLVD